MTKLEDRVLPHFESKVPANLRRSMSGSERDIWLADTLSRLDQKVDWTVEHLIETMEVSLAHQQTINRWRRWVESPIILLVGVVAWLAPWLVSLLMKC